MDFTQVALEDEGNMTNQPPPPSAQALQEYASKLRDVWMREEAHQEQQEKVKRMLKVAGISKGGLVGKLRSAVDTSRVGHSQDQGGIHDTALMLETCPNAVHPSGDRLHSKYK